MATDKGPRPRARGNGQGTWHMGIGPKRPKGKRARAQWTKGGIGPLQKRHKGQGNRDTGNGPWQWPLDHGQWAIGIGTLAHWQQRNGQLAMAIGKMGNKVPKMRKKGAHGPRKSRKWPNAHNEGNSGPRNNMANTGPNGGNRRPKGPNIGRKWTRGIWAKGDNEAP